MSDCSIYRCINIIVDEYFLPKYKENTMENAINYFLDKYIENSGTIKQKSSEALSKTIEKLLVYSHEVKKENCLEIDWESSK